jgi:hypothetical protein
VPDWLAFLLLIALWSLPLTLLHELGHGAAALLLTDGEVSIGLERGGLRGGWASYDSARVRRPRDEAWIFAAGPATSLAAAIVLWIAWVAGGSGSIVTVLGAGTVLAAFQFLLSAVPFGYGTGFAHHGVRESDGRAAWRILTGGPPSVDVEVREPYEDTVKGTRPIFIVVLLLIGVLAFLADPMLAVELAGIFAAAIVWSRVT